MSVSSGQMEVNTWSTGRIAFYRGTTQTMIIDATGSVGIGTATPVARMDISGSTVIRNTLTVNRNSVETYGALNVWDTTAGNGTSRIADFTNGTDVNLNFYTTQVGATTKFAEISSYGTIPLVLNNQSGGNVGIGTNSPSGGKLHIDGTDPFLRVNNTSANNHGIKISYNYSETHGLHLLYNANAATASIDNTYPITEGQVWGDIYFRQNSGTGMIPRMMIKADGGNVGINTIVPTAKLHVVGDIKASLSSNLTPNYVTYNTSTGLFGYAGTGSIVVGTATNADFVYVNTTTSNTNYSLALAIPVHDEYERLYADSTNATYNPSTGTLTVVTLNAQEKSFSIPHQGLPGKKLVYGVVEGPEHSVYVRGKSTERVIELPEEWEWLVDKDSITVSLTPIGEPNAIYVEEIADNKIYVNSNAGTFKYFYHVYATRKDVKPLKTIQ